MALQKKALENIVGKGENAGNQHFLLFPRCFFPYHTQKSSFNPLQNDKFLNWSKLKALADNKINVTEKFEFVLGRVENIVGKGENAGNQHFLLFPQCVQKASFFGVVKSWDCVVKS